MRRIAAIALQHARVARILRIMQDLRQIPGIAQAEIQALAGDRVQRLRGIADEGCARPMREARTRSASGERLRPPPRRIRPRAAEGRGSAPGIPLRAHRTSLRRVRAHAPHRAIAAAERQQASGPSGVKRSQAVCAAAGRS
jgi:hypothetical protein